MNWFIVTKLVLGLIFIGFVAMSAVCYVNQRQRNVRNNDYRHLWFCSMFFAIKLIFSKEVHFVGEWFAMKVLIGFALISVLFDILVIHRVRTKLDPKSLENAYRSDHPSDNVNFVLTTLNLALVMFTIYTYTGDIT